MPNRKMSGGGFRGITTWEREQVEWWEAYNVIGNWFVGSRDEQTRTIEIIGVGEGVAWSLILDERTHSVGTSSATVGEWETGVEL